MTVKELIQQLQQHDPDTRVVIRGSEDEALDLQNLEKGKIRLNINLNDEWYFADKGLNALSINGIEYR